MTVRARTATSVGWLLFLLGVARLSFAADEEAALQQAVQQITSLNKGAIAAYSAGDFDKAKAQLLQAVALGKKDPQLQTHPLMARTFLHLGVLYVDGFEDRAEGVRYFGKALKLRPDIELTPSLATKTAKSAFDEARGEPGGAVAPVAATGKAAPVAATGTEAAKGAAARAASPEAPGKAEEAAAEPVASEKPAPKLTAAEKRKAAEEARKAAAEEKRAAAEEKKRAAQEAKEAAAEEKRAAKDNKEKEKQAQAAQEKLNKELAQAKDSEAKEHAAKEKLQSEKTDKEKLLADSKAALERAQKDTKEKEKQAQAAQEKLTKELALVKDSEAKERAAKEKLQAEKADKEKQLADTKASLSQLQKEKADKEKQLADASGREKKEREAKEKLEKEKQAAETHEKERLAQQEKERVERDKLAAGPDLPAHLPEPLYCAIPDEVQEGKELFVHCAARPDVKVSEVSLFYRPSGAAHYNALVMDRSKKGWHVALIPADKVHGKSLQYYAEARDTHGAVAAATGKANSPNILSLRSAGGAAPGPRVTTAGRAAPKSR